MNYQRINALESELRRNVNIAIRLGLSREQALCAIMDLARREYNSLEGTVLMSAAELYVGDDSDWDARVAKAMTDDHATL